MDIKSKIGQLFIVGFNGKKPTDELINLIKEYKVGNIILFAENFSTKEELAKLTSFFRKTIKEATGINPLIGIDEEGGAVSRLPHDAAVMPSARAQANVGSKELLKKAAKIAGEELLSLGVNLNFAPVLDVNSNPKNPIIGVRSYGTTKEEVIKFAEPVIEGYKEAGILCCGKHFPGHGDTGKDSHVSLPFVEKTKEQMEECEIVPFKEMINKGLPAVMVAHIVVHSMESEKLPSTMSKSIITDCLRNELGFKGLVVTDCMEMDAIKEFYGIEKGAVGSIKAGADLVCISHTTKFAKAAVEALYKALESGEVSKERIDLAAEHVIAAKGKVKEKEISSENVGTSEQIAFADDFLDKTVRFLNKPADVKFSLGKNPLFLGPKPSQLTRVANIFNSKWTFADFLADSFGGKAITFSLNVSDEEAEKIDKAAKDATSVVLGTLNAQIFTAEQKVVEKIKAFNIPIYYVALKNPEDMELYPDNSNITALYEYSLRTLDVLKKHFKI